MYAKHSIKYTGLESYFYGFSIWNEKNECLSWHETIEWLQLLEIVSPHVLYFGIFDEEKIRSIFVDWTMQEGYVVRVTDKFSFGEFKKKVGKYVRKNHVQTVKHWMHGQPIEKNELAI
jgi:hypothetical protein